MTMVRAGADFRVYMCVYMHIHICMHTYVHIYIYIPIYYICIYVCIYAYMYVCKYTYSSDGRLILQLSLTLACIKVLSKLSLIYRTFRRHASPPRAAANGVDWTLPLGFPTEVFFSKIIQPNSSFGTPEGSLTSGVRNALVDLISMYVHVCACICLYIHMFYVYIYTYTHIHTYICMYMSYIHIYINIYVLCICVCALLCMCLWGSTCVYVYMYMFICIYVYRFIYTYMNTYMPILCAFIECIYIIYK